MSVVVQLHGIRKSFGANMVLRGIDLTLHAGQVTVLMGANGAGKSTLVKILCGVHSSDHGRIELLGKPFNPSTPSEAIRAGIVTVHQSINDGVVADLDVAANLLLDELASGHSPLFYNRRKIRKQAQAIALTIGLEMDVSTPVSSLSLADRQLVAVARAMAHDPRVLVLDEPTSSLSSVEAKRLFLLIERLKQKGVAILFISHRMSDIRVVADSIVSMRDGAIVGVFESRPLDYEGAVNAMLGKRMSELTLDRVDPAAAVLQLQDLQLRPDSSPLSMQLHKNEVVAITGLVGSGKTALAECLFGLHQAHAGVMRLAGAEFKPRSASDAIQKQVFLCAKDRSSNGVVADFSIVRNISLPFLEKFSSLGFISPKREQAQARQLIDEMGVVCQGSTDNIMTLSGGNQQKVMVARWLSQPCELLILDEPFQGVDIQARRDIAAILRQTAHSRATVVFVSEIDEALEIADRILVMCEHTIVGEHKNHTLDIDLLLAQVAGAGVEKEVASVA